MVVWAFMMSGMSGMSGSAGLALTGCSSSHPQQTRRAAVAPLDPARIPAAELHRAFVLHFEGARIGYAVEDERVSGGRRVLRRRELVRFRRGEELATFEIQLLVRGAASGEADEVDLAVRHCTVRTVRTVRTDATARTDATDDPAALLAEPRFEARFADGLSSPCPPGTETGPLQARATARRHASGWQIADGRSIPPRVLPAAAQPAEWLDTLPDRRDARALLFFATRSFALGRASRRWLDERTWLGAVELEGAVLESTTVLDEVDDRPRLVLDGNGVTATRVYDDALKQPLDLADLVDLTTLPIAGTAPHPGAPIRLRLALRDPAAAAAALPEAPGQRVTALPGGWRVELVPQPAPRPPAAWASLDATAVATLATLARQIADDELLPGDAHDARDASLASQRRGGDCTTHALRLAAAVTARGMPVRIATGFVVNPPEQGGVAATLVRHRWVVVWTGARWISVDPSSGEAPAPPRLLTLALHHATPEALAAADVAFAAVHHAAVAWVP
jgi:Transglutaminase-like superfamily